MSKSNLNSINFMMIGGKIKSLIKVENANGIEAQFILCFYHASKPENGKTTKYKSILPVTVYGKPAEKVLKKFRDNDEIIVQGHLRQHESGKYKLIGVHIAFAEPVWIDDNEIVGE